MSRPSPAVRTRSRSLPHSEVLVSDGRLWEETYVRCGNRLASPGAYCAGAYAGLFETDAPNDAASTYVSVLPFSSSCP